MSTCDESRSGAKKNALIKAAERFEGNPDEILTAAEVAERLREQANES